MLEVILWVCVFIVSIVVLVKSSDYFTDAAEQLGLRLGFSPFIIGVTIVAIGTSLPELVASIIAVIVGNSEIVVGTVVGGNIARILLVLGLAAILGKKLTIAHELISVDLPILVGAAFLFSFMIIDGLFTWIDGLLLLFLFLVYLKYTFVSEKRSDKEIKKEMVSEERTLRSELKKSFPWMPFIVVVISGLFIYVGARYTISSVINLATLFGTHTDIIALTAVALGTTLPELSVTIVAARKHKAEIAIGNILGSNIFNTLVVMGIPSLFGVLIVPSTILVFALPVMLAATFLYFFMVQDKQMTEWEGYLLVVFYAFFLLRIIGLL